MLGVVFWPVIAGGSDHTACEQALREAQLRSIQVLVHETGEAITFDEWCLMEKPSK